MKICVECKHCIRLGYNKHRGMDDFFCGSSTVETIRDPVTGYSLVSANRSKHAYYTPQGAYASCYDVNLTGECEMWEEKEG